MRGSRRDRAKATRGEVTTREEGATRRDTWLRGHATRATRDEGADATRATRDEGATRQGRHVMEGRTGGRGGQRMKKKERKNLRTGVRLAFELKEGAASAREKWGTTRPRVCQQEGAPYTC